MDKLPNNFGCDIDASTQRQKRLTEFLKLKGHTIIDKSQDLAAQAAGYDFVMNGEPCEFKFDTKICRTKNVACEMMSNQELNKPGWYATSKMRWLFYLDDINNVCYQFDFPKFKRAFDADINFYLPFKARTDNKYTSSGLLVPLKFFESHQCIEQVLRLL